MTTVFISYSHKDHYFAELAAIKLEGANIHLWRDRGQLRAGSEWRGGIEQGIAQSIAVILALSQTSTESSYVTFEWAYALGKGRTVVPIKLEACKMHPRLEPIQYLDFSIPGSLPWNLLVERIREIESDATSQDDLAAAAALPDSSSLNGTVKAILAYLNQRGYRMVSYERLRQRVDPTLTDPILDALVAANPTILRKAILKGGKHGVSKLIP